VSYSIHQHVLQQDDAISRRGESVQHRARTSISSAIGLVAAEGEDALWKEARVSYYRRAWLQGDDLLDAEDTIDLGYRRQLLKQSAFCGAAAICQMPHHNLHSKARVIPDEGPAASDRV
jgi:hypothetical protein